MSKNFVEPSEELWQAVSAIAEDEGLSLYDLQRQGEIGLRVVLAARSKDDAKQNDSGEEDASKAEGGVTSGDCSRVCRRLMVFFSVEGIKFSISAEPQLEVSSPGINRELRLDEHFLGALGERVTLVPLREANLGGPVTGVLKSSEDGLLKIVTEAEGEERTIARGALKKAHLDFKF